MEIRELTIEHADRSWHEAFLQYTDRVFPDVTFRRWYAEGGWDETYTAFSLGDGKRIVANASVSRMATIVDGDPRTGYQLATVGVLPEYRGRGLSRRVIARLLAHAPVDALVYLFANEGVLDFYPKVGFQRIVEHTFGMSAHLEPSGPPLQKLSPSVAAHRQLVRELTETALPVTERFGARDYGGAVLWYWTNYLQDALYFAEAEAAIVVAEQEGDVLKIYDIIASTRVDPAPLLPRVVTRTVRSIELTFTPDVYFQDARALAPYVGAPLFVYGADSKLRGPLKYPLLAQT